MQMAEKVSLELSVIMPCRNEEATIGYCVDEARQFMENHQINGEVLVVDNGSADASAELARQHGARVVSEERAGYGNAIRTGIGNSKGRVVIIGDCDTTYDFLGLEEMYGLLSQEKCDMVIGNRFAGGIERGSMPLSHRWGVRFLSFCGRVRFQTKVYDFHCGLRGLTRDAAEQLDLCTEGMEFATEMIGVAVNQGLRILQVPVVLRRCKYGRESKLRTIRDGVRHLEYILMRKGER